MRNSLLTRRAQWLLLACCVFRLWIVPLPSSFWVDEAGTMFVVRQGAHHPSLVVAPQVPASVYFWLPRAMDRLLRFVPDLRGVTETAYRLPSVLAMALAVWLIARIAARLIRPDAAWFAAFACFGLGGLNYEAGDARPYALGILAVSASVFLLIRWLDRDRLIDAAAFLVCAALIWRVHLVFWPFYAVLAVYAIVRLLRSETAVTPLRALVVFGVLGVALLPVLIDALSLFRQAGAHVIAPVPPGKELVRALKFGLPIYCFILAALLRFRSGFAGWRGVSISSAALIVAWWIVPPLALFGFSWMTGNSVFVNRYLSFGLPGVALAATAAASTLLPVKRWTAASLLLGAGVLYLLGDWHHPWPAHTISNWRGAAETMNALPDAATMPVLCPSPFIEARPPVWNPSYRLPGFLYAHLATYPVHGKLFLFPFATSPQAEEWAAAVGVENLSPAARFVLYGSASSVRFWRGWYKRRPEFNGWRDRSLGDFGDVAVVEFYSK